MKLRDDLSLTDKINFLSLMSDLNLEYNHLGLGNLDYADLSICNIAAKFVSTYREMISQAAPTNVVVVYNTDVFSLISLKIVKVALSYTHGNSAVYLYGDFASKAEKDYFKKYYPDIKRYSSLKKIKKLKGNTILIDSFNPIVNVDFRMDYSKEFIEIFQPLRYLRPSTLQNIYSFYAPEDKDYRRIIEGNSLRFVTGNYDTFERFYEFPDRATFTVTRSNEDKPFVHFVLDDTEASYPLFSLIWESAKEGNIHLYTFLGDESQIEHLGKFLKKYGFDSNIPNPINIVTLDEAITMLQMTESGGNSVWYDDDLDEARKELSEN